MNYSNNYISFTILVLKSKYIIISKFKHYFKELNKIFFNIKKFKYLIIFFIKNL